MAYTKFTLDAETAKAVQAFIKVVDAQSKAQKSFKRTTKAARNQETILNRLGRNGANALRDITRSTVSLRGAILGMGAGYLAREFIKVSSSVEGYTVRLSTLLGSQEAANAALEDFNVLAARTPATLGQVIEAGTTLSAMGADYRKWLDPLNDLAAVMGMELPDAASALGRAYAGGAGAADIFRERGILQVIKDFARLKYGVEDITKLTLPQFRRVMHEAFTDPDGKIAGAGEKLSKTWGGLISMLGDQWFRFRQEAMAAGAFDEAKTGVESLLETIKELERDGTLESWAKIVNKSFEVVIEGAEYAARKIDDLFELTTQAQIRAARERVKYLESEVRMMQRGVASTIGEVDIPLDSPELVNKQITLLQSNLRMARAELNRLLKQAARAKQPPGGGPPKTPSKDDKKPPIQVAGKKVKELTGLRDTAFPAYLQRQMEWELEGVHRISPEEWGRLYAAAHPDMPKRVSPEEWGQKWLQEYGSEELKRLEEVKRKVQEIRGSFEMIPDSIEYGMGGALSNLMTEIGSLGDITNRTFTQIGQTIRQTAGEALFDLVTGTFSWEETVEQLSKNVIRSFSQMVVDMIAQKILMATVGKSILAAELAAMAPFAAGAAGMWSPAAVAASIATGGSASAVGLAMYQNSLVLGRIAATASALVPFGEGGLVTRPTPALIGEKGPELVIPLDRLGGQPSMVVHHYNFTNSTILDGPSLEAYIKHKSLEAMVEDYHVDGVTRKLMREGR